MELRTVKGREQIADAKLNAVLEVVNLPVFVRKSDSLRAQIGREHVAAGLVGGEGKSEIAGTGADIDEFR
jgi:hypothetical protein